MTVTNHAVRFMADRPESEGDDGQLATAVAKPRLQMPPLYRVIMLNDDFTPMEFVVEVLQMLFHMDADSAHQTMLTVHVQGQAVCGIYPRDIAETKAHQVTQLARMNEHPLRCEVEPVEHGEE